MIKFAVHNMATRGKLWAKQNLFSIIVDKLCQTIMGDTLHALCRSVYHYLLHFHRLNIVCIVINYSVLDYAYLDIL